MSRRMAPCDDGGMDGIGIGQEDAIDLTHQGALLKQTAEVGHLGELVQIFLGKAIEGQDEKMLAHREGSFRFIPQII